MSENWQRVGDAIARRLAELRLSKAEFLKRSGISDKTLTGYLNGKPIKRVDKARDLCAALGWTFDSVDRLLEGGDPVITIPDQIDLVLSRLDEQREILDEILAELRGRPR